MMLQPIVDAADLRAAEADKHLDQLVREATHQQPPRGFAAALAVEGLSVVAEIKRRSPSAGQIDADLDPVGQALAYEEGGASAISILTEPEFFGGSLLDLTAVRQAVSLPVLRKDFTRSEAQIWEARAAGADAVLLIVAILDDARLARFLEVADEAGLDAIVEVHTKLEMTRAADCGAAIIGVNNRDLTTFETDLAVAEELAGVIPDGALSIGESGVSTVGGAARMRAAGYDAVLVGEALVRSRDPQKLVNALRSAS
jgi:indole-3-glycerol phosphate synthase